MSRKYLVVDDNAEFAENVAEILTDAGAEVSTACDAQGALEQLRSTRFDGVVTDMRMPGLSGAELLRKLRVIDPGVPVVLLSAWAQDEQVVAARRMGLLAFLSKASGTPHLIELMEHARRDASVVLIDDDRALVDNLSEALACRGFTVCAASSVKELEEIAVKPIAALVDVRLPGAIDGAALTRVNELFPGTPLLVVTAAREFEKEGLEIFRKPFDTAKLVARLEALAQKAGAA
ncbi:MAG: response regulator [Archangium sp.]|nr:response regulator [Archangium sp.]MDP3152696.1 response regulator [Archangium sp.]MDP3574832.1 response regulator [Archangium sp.]